MRRKQNKRNNAWSYLAGLCALISVSMTAGCPSGTGGGNSGGGTVPKNTTITESSDVEQDILDFIGSPRFQRYDTEEKLDKTAEYLNGLAEEGKIREDSVTIHENLDYVSFEENEGGTAIIDFRPQEEGTGSYTVDDCIQNIPIVTKPDTAADIILFAGFFNTEKENYEYYSELSDYFSNSPLMNGEIRLATLANLRNGLMNRDMVIIACHGSLFDYYGEETTFLTAFDDTVDSDTVEDYENGRTVKLITTSKEVHYAMTPEFFSYYYGGGKLKDTIIHMSSCFCFGRFQDDNYVLTDTLLYDCGAETVIGHDNAVYIVYDYMLLMKELQVLENGGTVREALNAALEEYGDNDRDYLLKITENDLSRLSVEAHTPAHTGIRGNGDAKLFDPPVIMEEPEETEEPVRQEETKKDERWKDAYTAVLKGLSSSTRFCLVYIDGDDIPELVTADDNSHAAYAYVYTCADGNAVLLGTEGTFGQISFCPKKNMILSTSVYGGEAEMLLTKITDGALQSDLVLFTNEGGTAPENVIYMINGKEVSYDAYYSEYSSRISSVTFIYAGYDQGFRNIPEQMEYLRNNPDLVTIY